MKLIIVATLVAALGATGCQKTEVAAAPAASASAVTEAEASKAFDETVTAWQSMDAAKIKAVYAPDVTGFDYNDGPLVPDRAAWDKNQDAFAAAKLDKIDVVAKKIQLLGNDAFVVTSQSNGMSSATPTNNSTFRCTDVYRRDAAGAWLIVNENCSPMPKA